MNADTQTITINADAGKVFEFVSNPENLPKWAKGLCSDVWQDGDNWGIQTELGEMRLQMRTNAETGVADFVISPPFPIKIAVHSRVLPNGRGAEYIFTQYQYPLIPESTFQKQKIKLAEGLQALKQLMES